MSDRCRRRQLEPGHARNLTRVVGSAGTVAIAAVLTFLGHRRHHIARGFVHVAEDREVPLLVEASRIGPHQEELGTVAARAAICHRHHPFGVRLGPVRFVGELVARTTFAGPTRVSTLQDENCSLLFRCG